MNLAQAAEKKKVKWLNLAGVDSKITGVGEDLCSETESESESDGEHKEYVPTPHGTQSPRTIPSGAMGELMRRVYGTEQGDTPIIICEDKVEAMGIIMMQLNLKQGLKTWGKRVETSAIKEM